MESERTDSLDNSSDVIWPVLESDVTQIIQGEEEIIFKFENNLSIKFWQEKEDNDNLLIIRNRNSDEWFTYG